MIDKAKERFWALVDELRAQGVSVRSFAAPYRELDKSDVEFVAVEPAPSSPKPFVRSFGRTADGPDEEEIAREKASETAEWDELVRKKNEQVARWDAAKAAMNATIINPGGFSGTQGAHVEFDEVGPENGPFWENVLAQMRADTKNPRAELGAHTAIATIKAYRTYFERLRGQSATLRGAKNAVDAYGKAKGLRNQQTWIK